MLLHLIINFVPLKDFSLHTLQKLILALKSSNLNELYFSLTSKISQPEALNDLKNKILLTNNVDFLFNDQNIDFEGILKLDQLNYLPNLYLQEVHYALIIPQEFQLINLDL